LLAIGGVYLTADAMDAGTRGQSAQVWLDHESVKVAKLD
jgi:septum site-determining protein MinC